MSFQVGRYPYPVQSGNFGTATNPSITQNTASRFDIPRWTNQDRLEGTDIKPSHIRIRAGIGDCLLRWDANSSLANYDVQCSVSVETVIAIPAGANYFTLFNSSATPVVAIHYGRDK